MIGVSLSRWTMSYFAAALLALLAAKALMAAGWGYPSAALSAPETLILVHVAAIGWLSLLMCGALLQFVPVLLAQPLHSDALALPALVALVAGLAALILGFLQLGSRVDPAVRFLAVAAALLSLGFVLILWNLGRTFATAKAPPLSARFVAVGLASLVAAVALGAVFAADARRNCRWRAPACADGDWTADPRRRRARRLADIHRRGRQLSPAGHVHAGP